MSPYFEHLKFPVQFDSEFARFDCGARELGYMVREHTSFSPELQQILLERGLRISHTALFHTPAHTVLPIHSDIPELQNFAKLNIAFGGEGSRMFWYKFKPGFQFSTVVPSDTEKYSTLAGSGGSYVSVPSNEVLMVSSTKVKCTWVNASIPHSVLNNTAERRWVISIPLRDVSDDHKITFKEGAERLKEFR